LVVVVASVLFSPAFELPVLCEQKPECLAHDIGLVSADELGVLVQFEFYMLLDSYLDYGILELLWRCFQNGQTRSPFAYKLSDLASDELLPVFYLEKTRGTVVTCAGGRERPTIRLGG
jgi:hypothetical protein